MGKEIFIYWLTLLLMLGLLYGALWRLFTLAGLRGWYALIPGWVFYCWARMVRIKHPIHCALMTSIFIYGISYVMPWYGRIFGEPSVNDIVNAVPPTVLVSKVEFFIFGLFLLSIMFGIYQYIRLCWRMTEAFSFKAWLAILMILMPPLSLIIGLWIIVISRRPFKVLELP
ncbi:MAG: hypothetical protein K2Q33_03620 [Gammaproteobacteria bacterium]|nr:hypothetical protein [Gammaproteobacteria bacterium]